MQSRFLVAALVGLVASRASAGEMTGKVVSERRGVAGATVSAIAYEAPYGRAMRELSGQRELPPIASATTAGDGRFKLQTPATAPPYTLRVTFGGLAAKNLEAVYETSDAEDIGEINLGRSESMNGRVVDTAGKPIAGAVVRFGRDGSVKTTDRDGLFRFDDIEAPRNGPLTFGGNQSLSVVAAGFELQVAAAKFQSPITVKMKASATKLSGTLKDASGKPAAEAAVRWVGASISPWARTDAAGRFDIPGTPKQQGRVQAITRDGSSADVSVAAGEAKVALTLSRAATIEGRVTQIDNGKLVPGVKVVAKAQGATTVARTGVDGRYRLTGLSQANYRVTYDEKRFVLLERRDIDVAPGESKTIDVALTPAVTLVGRVTDENGQPVAGARGTLSPGSESRMGVFFRMVNRDGAAPAAFTSGADGSFKASRLAPGTNQKLTVTHPDFERRVVPGVDLVAGAAKPVSVDVVLSPGWSIAGTVKDKDGKPVATASVSLVQSVQMMGGRGGNVVSFVSADGVRPQIETDYDGKFSFKGLSAGNYDVTVTKSGFTRNTSQGVKAGENSSSVDVVLSPGASISGRVIQTNGLPVTGYSVTARPTSAGNTGVMMMARGGSSVQLDPDGLFSLDGLVPGTSYDLSLLGGGNFSMEPRKKGVIAPAAEVEIEVATRGRITGRVVDAGSGAPVTEFEAQYTPASRGGMRIVMRGPGDEERRTPFSSPDGAFVFEDVAPGNWDVTVWAKTYQEARTGGVAVAAGETKTIDVKASRGLVIRGRVLDTKGGRPVPDASVTARDDSSGGGMFILGPDGAGGVTTDAEGRFEIPDKGPGSYQLTARHPLFSEGTARLKLEEKDGSIDIPVVGGGVIAGVVISAQGAPISGAEVGLQDANDGGPMRFGMDSQSALTDGGGRFRFEHLAASRYKVGASLRNDASPLVDVPLGAGDVREDIRLSLNSGATVRGVVSGVPDAERTGIMVGASGTDGYFANARTNGDGSFEFAGVPKGNVTLRATVGDFISGTNRTALKELVIPEGQQEVTTEIIFDEGISITGTVMRRGAPIPGARVSAFGARQASGRTDDNGSFKLTGLDKGRYTVVAFGEDFSSQVSQTIELAGDTSVDLVIPVAKVRGVVVDASTSLPLESSVELRKAAASTGVASSPRLNVSTDTSGQFTFDDLETVDYSISARRSGYEAVTKTVRPTEAGEDLRIELKRGSGLAIEAKDAQMGFGIRSIFVRVQQGNTESFMGPISLDGEGKGEIPGLPPGAYSVFAQAGGYAPVHINNVQAPATVLRLPFLPGGTVEFRTTEDFLAGGAKSGQLVSLTGSPIGMGTPNSNSFRLSRTTQRMENMAPGRYRLTLDGGIDKTFDVTEGGVAVVTIP